MNFLPFDEAVPLMDKMSQAGQSFSFIIDYKGEKCAITEALDFRKTNCKALGIDNTLNEHKDYFFSKNAVGFELYQQKFNQVQEALRSGNTFLLNLTQETEIKTNLTLEAIYLMAKSRYKFLLKDQFVVFSPETFIQIKDHHIYSFPMKGTQIDDGPNAKKKLLDNQKENAEHATIVDLIRNDLSKVAFPIRVEQFKYVEKVKTHEGTLWQMSSKISGKLTPIFRQKIGSILRELLPAGSITGAPKKSTCDLIEAIEGYDRGFYTGIMGTFDGQNLDSAVMIRFIEKKGEQLFFKSGGGITVFSNVRKEYQELNDKIYLPF